jgi:hypothetical protein
MEKIIIKSNDLEIKISRELDPVEIFKNALDYGLLIEFCEAVIASTAETDEQRVFDAAQEWDL